MIELIKYVGEETPASNGHTTQRNKKGPNRKGCVVSEGGIARSVATCAEETKTAMPQAGGVVRRADAVVLFGAFEENRGLTGVQVSWFLSKSFCLGSKKSRILRENSLRTMCTKTTKNTGY